MAAAERGKPLMDINQLREFTVFARHLNFSKAALALGIAQPTLSSHIASMEMELGFKLVQREKPLRITPAGKQFCVECERILTSFDSAIKACKELAKKRVGSLTFELPIAQGGISSLFSKILLYFRKEYPTISIRKHEGTDMSLKDILYNGLADVGLVLNPDLGLMGIDPDDIELLPIHTKTLGPYYLWMDESHPLAKRDKLEIRDLEGCHFLFPSSIQYQGLENIATLAESMLQTKVACVLWPGSYEECVMRITEHEVMIVSETDLLEPAYSLVEGRTTVPLMGMDDFMKPCFIYLKSNENPSLDALKDFISGMPELS